MRISSSVGAKLFGLVFAVLLLNLGLLGAANVSLHRRHLETETLRAAERMNNVIVRSIGYAMLRNDRDGMQRIVDSVGREPAITQISIANHLGDVAFFAKRGLNSGERVLQVVTPIHNAPSCASGQCHAHPSTQPTLGVLQTNVSLAEADHSLGIATWQFIAYSALAILLTLASTGIFVYYFVHKPVGVLRAGTQAVARGELGVQIPYRSDDELGALAWSFNGMSRQLAEARKESETFAHVLEKRIQEKTTELQAAHQHMLQAEKLQSLGKLAAVVAHEINNPLSGILTYARLMRKWIERKDSLEQRGPEMRDALQLIETESRRCGDIVQNLLAFSRVPPMNVENVDLNVVVRRTIKLVEHKLELANITRHLELDEALPFVRGDGAQLEQLLLALIMNAIDAMNREGTLHIVTKSADDKHVALIVEDDGSGIPPELLPHLFEPFVTTKEEGKGVGLGLAVSRSVVDRHHGKISVKSEVGRGTAFTIELPIAPPGGERWKNEDAFSSSTMNSAFATV